MDNTTELVEYVNDHQPDVMFLDIGKVLIDINFQHQNSLTLDCFDELTREDYKQFVEQYFHRFLAGTISSPELDQLFTKELNIEGSLTDCWRSAFKNSYTPNEELIAYLGKWEEKTQLSIISNIFPEFLQELKATNLLDRFVDPVYSCEVGFAKPDPKIFLAALTKFADTKAENCLFVDDKKKHLKAAAQVGLPTFHYTKYKNPETEDFTNV